jgi:hypothetical protein
VSKMGTSPISLSDFPKTSLIVEISTTFPRQASPP